MRRLLIIGLTALLVAAPLAAPAAAINYSAARAAAWGEIADEALELLEVAPRPAGFRAFTISHELLAIGRRQGWNDSRIPGLLAELLALRNPDGGWGIGVTRGTNPPSTTYTVTLAGHVGPALLEAYAAGALTDPEPLSTISRLLMTTARINTAEGQCIAYSRAAADAGPGMCVHNVNAGAADYLTRASAAGFGRKGLQALVVDITRREVSAYRAEYAGWTYADNRTAEQDPDHQAYSGRSLYFLTYPVGREAVYQGITAPTVDTNGDGQRAHLQLVSVPGGPGSQGLVDPGTTLWCEIGDRWVSEARAYVLAAAGDAMRLSQAAALAAENARACA